MPHLPSGYFGVCGGGVIVLFGLELLLLLLLDVFDLKIWGLRPGDLRSHST